MRSCQHTGQRNATPPRYNGSRKNSHRNKTLVGSGSPPAVARRPRPPSAAGRRGLCPHVDARCPVRHPRPPPIDASIPDGLATSVSRASRLCGSEVPQAPSKMPIHLSAYPANQRPFGEVAATAETCDTCAGPCHAVDATSDTEALDRHGSAARPSPACCTHGDGNSFPGPAVVRAFPALLDYPRAPRPTRSAPSRALGRS